MLEQKRGINNSTIVFALEYIKNPVKVGTIFQSSIFLAKKKLLIRLLERLLLN